MNQLILEEIPLKRAYIERKASLERLLTIIFPDIDASTIWDKPIPCSELNDAICDYLKKLLCQSTPELCLDCFVDMFGDDTIDAQKITITQSIHEIVAHKDVILNNIARKCQR